jgi:hypothetical protein
MGNASQRQGVSCSSSHCFSQNPDVHRSVPSGQEVGQSATFSTQTTGQVVEAGHVSGISE